MYDIFLQIFKCYLTLSFYRPHTVCYELCKADILAYLKDCEYFILEFGIYATIFPFPPLSLPTIFTFMFNSL